MSSLLVLEDVTKRFGATTVLDGISMEVEEGSVHCLLGDNGAGKSTLIKVVSGVVKPTRGRVLLEGHPALFESPRAAIRAGIGTVHQDSGTFPLMSVGRNFFLGSEPLRGWWPFRRIDFGKANDVSIREMQALGIRQIVDGRQLVGTMSGGERQALAISRALFFGARVLMLDEPTASLGVKEAGIVLRSIAHARDRGLAIIFVTHNATHALSLGDRFTVLIHGLVAAAFNRGERTHEEVVSLMAGGEELAAIESDLERSVERWVPFA